MNTKLSLLLSVCVLLLLAGCEKTETFDTRWKDSNEAQFAKIERDAGYTKLESQSKNGHIMYKEITDSKSGIKPTFEKTVKVLYTGWYKNDWTREDTYTNSDGNRITNKIIFDSTADRNDIPSKLSPRSVVDGFATALQHMEVGDKWEVWIPWQLGYGASGRGDIKGYTTMVFEIEMIEIL
ncbi:FKBP-type peptidyl-prolyl cis-trans isomerase [Petrimonas sp.]|uniref:FKBP-type peptidyl-prolyl cis-trans isomerase n=1 Tax=Petrimonas sp. TaxID=2023866 RepID=UPI003F50EE62